MQEKQGDGGGQPALEPEKGKKTRYMVLFAPEPDKGDPRKWREIGWYEGHSIEQAKVAARDDTDSGVHGQLLDLARPGNRGFKLRAVAERAWPEDEGPVYVQETSWSTRAEDADSSEESS